MGMLYKRGEVFWTNTIAAGSRFGKVPTQKSKRRLNGS